jgi:hypothetical protein
MLYGSQTYQYGCILSASFAQQGLRKHVLMGQNNQDLVVVRIRRTGRHADSDTIIILAGFIRTRP